ncbi:MAG: BREX-6 system phosphatase PglZ [Myxococcaceae bacterium]
MSEPVTSALEQRLLAEIQSKRLVVWLDAEGTFTAFATRLAERSRAKQFPASVVAFRGSFLEMMLELRGLASTIDKPPLLVHLPGFNTDSVRKTPLLEVYEAASPFQVRLDTQIREVANGRLPLPEIERFLAEPGLSLASADAWFAQAGTGAGLVVAWVDTLEPVEFLAHLWTLGKDAPSEMRAATRRRAEALFGVTASWVETWRSHHEDDAQAIIAWLLCVEYVFDLNKPPKRAELVALRQLPQATVKRCQAQAARLRRDQPDAYRAWALAVEQWLGSLETEVDPRLLGRIDTFRFEALSIYRGAVRALAEGDYAQVQTWAEAHEESAGFWVQHEQPRRWAWSLIADAARLGLALKNAELRLDGVRTLEDATTAYVELAAPVDRAHRTFEQRFSALYGPLLPELTALDAAFEKVRFAYEEWSKRLAAEFNAVCQREGALPPPELQQRALFEQVVLPLLKGSDRTALFLLDALRFEMALELRDELAAAGLQFELRPRLAELPTITSVGMNVLSPVARDGRLSPVRKAGRFEGFRTGEVTVARPKDRVKAMELRVGKQTRGVSLAEVRAASASTLKNQVSQCHLMVVHATEIDDAGEAGLGVDVFEKVIRDVVTARHQLEAAGITQFVFTSDHGFLLGRGRQAHVFGSRGEPQRRYVFSEQDRTDPGHLTVSLASLGYEGGGVLQFRDDTDEFKVNSPPGAFTHGGNSLQERVIPVLKAWRKRPSAEVPLRIGLVCERMDPVMGIQRLKVRAQPIGQSALNFSAGAVDVVLTVPERTGDIRVVIKDVSGGGASAHAGGLRLDAGTAEWTEVFFVLEGSSGERLPVELSVLNDRDSKASPDAFYPVSFVGGPAQPAPATASPLPQTGWAQRLGDPDAGKVFDHLEKFGELTEAHLVELLGNARKARAFAARFDGFLERLTFEVEVISGSDGKQYRKR